MRVSGCVFALAMAVLSSACMLHPYARVTVQVTVVVLEQPVHEANVLEPEVAGAVRVTAAPAL